MGHTIKVRGRNEGIHDAHLCIQTGFSNSVALEDAINKRIPFIIMEAPHWRSLSLDEWVSWGYNGLAGGAFRHKPPDTPRPKPVLQPWKTEGSVVIFGQKPTDHSLRGADHGAWLSEKLNQYPDAEFRPHPLMSPTPLEPIEAVLDRCKMAITYTSTTGAEALIAGCESKPEHPGSTAHDVQDRESWLHDLSWGHFALDEFGRIGAKHIIGGYDEAVARMEYCMYERPRARVNAQETDRSYYAALEAWGHRTRG